MFSMEKSPVHDTFLNHVAVLPDLISLLPIEAWRKRIKVICSLLIFISPQFGRKYLTPMAGGKQLAHSRCAEV